MASPKTYVAIGLVLFLNLVLFAFRFRRFGMGGLSHKFSIERSELNVTLETRGEEEGAAGVGEDGHPLPSSYFQVPNIVHYIWYSKERKPLRFHHMLSVISAHKILQPDVIYFHTDNEPIGLYWERILQLSTVKVIHREPPLQLFGEKVKKAVFETSHSNIDRVKVLMEYGGIYLDLDVLVTRSFDDLRRYPCTIGKEDKTKVCGGVIVCSKDSPFLLLWINSYLDDYRSTEWSYNTGHVSFNLARRYPHLVHVDEDRINRPNCNELDKIWGPNEFDWQNNYAVHLWYGMWRRSSLYYDGVEPNDENIKTWNATFGEIARSILDGVKNIIHVY